MNNLPFHVTHVGVPPIKCQGIKTKLVPFIFDNVCWDANSGGRWIEPFLGSGVVAFNLAPPKALLADTNKHIIGLYQAIQKSKINRGIVRDFLYEEGLKLAAKGQDYYYEVRERFNHNSSPLDFLFLNRCCFNGVIRFNSKGQFNVPFGHKPERFSQSYITKIVNQVSWIEKQMRDKDWEFRVSGWDESLANTSANDFAYLDPPYIGRNTDYFNGWSEIEAVNLAQTVRNLSCGFALSMWMENRYRKNDHLEQYWSGLETRIFSHFYHVGSTENLRNEMNEALIIKPDYSSSLPYKPKQVSQFHNQLPLLLT